MADADVYTTGAASIQASRICAAGFMFVRHGHLSPAGITEELMFARVTSFKVDPARLPELEAKVQDLGKLAKALPGMIDAYATWRADGQGMVVSIYESQRQAEAAAARIQAVFGALAAMLTAPPKTDIYENVAHITQ
jgi:hypothetical protein